METVRVAAIIEDEESALMIRGIKPARKLNTSDPPEGGGARGRRS